jgi:hypothetical protein
VAIEYRWAEGRSERFREIAAEFVHLKVDVIMTVGGAATAAAQATSTIPIVLLGASTASNWRHWIAAFVRRHPDGRQATRLLRARPQATPQPRRRAG